MPTFRRGDFICHSNAAPPKRNLYTSPMIIMIPNSRSGFFLKSPSKGVYQGINLKYKSYVEVNAILIGNGYMFTGEETKDGKHYRYYSKVV